MEEQGDLRSGGDGTEGSAGLQPRRPVARTPAPCVPAPWTRWAAYGGMQASCGGQGTAWALPGRERAPGTRESPGESPRPGRRGLHCLPGLLPWGLTVLARGPGSPQVNAFCGRQGQEVADSLTEVGVRALWDPGRSAHSPFSQSSAQTLESRSVSVQVFRLGAGWGRLSQERLLAPQAGLRPETPRETRSLGVGPARPGPPHLAGNRGRPLFPAPCP